jgi:sucrose-6F-phosphate phosphohydrolase
MNNHFNPESQIAPSVLASDLDGTLIPLPDYPSNLDALAHLKKALNAAAITTIFATGRHFESVLEAMAQYDLPTPDWIVCDVGSGIYQRVNGRFERLDTYASHLEDVSGGVDREAIEAVLHCVEGLELQPLDHQQQFKISYQSSSESVYRLVDEVEALLKECGLSYGCMGSVDPFLNRGLLDVMPNGISKAYALLWLSQYANFQAEEVVYAGDSGNDFAALVSGFRSIIVANASAGLVDDLQRSLAQRSLESRLYVSKGTASSGVLEGCHYFGLLSPES